jgi:succinate-semialdehyde dehydrogenase/glutarate-semialdehyde dehydrogenase
VADAKKEGHQILVGGKRAEARGSGYFFEPTVIKKDRLSKQQKDLELFGPILFITEVECLEEAVRLANDSDYGLTASVWTSNKKLGSQIAAQLETGSVMVNDSVVSFGIPEAHWTGTKKSGIGWVHGLKGFEEMMNMKYVNHESQFHSQKFWWFPYSSGMTGGIKSALNVLFSNKLTRRLASLPALLKQFTGYLLLNRRRKDKY